MSRPPTNGVRAGVRATFLGTVLAGLLQFGLMVVLARLLEPVDYGAYALCVSIASMSAVFITNVTERALVVDENADGTVDESPIILLLTIGTGAVAVAVAAALNALNALQVDTRLLAVTLLSNVVLTAAIVPRVSMRRQLLFGFIVTAELSSLALGAGVVTVGLALAGWGRYALATGAVVQNLLLVVLLRWRVGDALAITRPSFARGVRLVRSALALGRTAAAEIANGQVAPLVLATQLGVISLGLFNRTYSLVQMPIQLLTGSMSRVMISALFAMREDRERFRNNARLLVQLAGVTVAPVAAGIAATNTTFILLAFGPKWLEARFFLPLLALSAWAVMMGTLYGIAMEALRAFDLKTRTQLGSTAFLIALSLAGARLGLVGAVAGIAIGSCIYLLLTARAAASLLDIRIGKALGWLVPGLMVAIPCFAVAWGIGRAAGDLPVAILFGLQVAACGIVDAVALLLLYPYIALQLIEGAAPAALRALPALARLLARRAGMVER